MRANQSGPLSSTTAAQRPSVGRMVHVVFVRQLQHHLQGFTQEPEGSASRQPGVFARASLATGVVSERL